MSATHVLIQQRRREKEAENGMVNGPGANRSTLCESCANPEAGLHSFCGGRDYVPESRNSHTGLFAGQDAYRYVKQKPHGPGRGR
jgi:hypothetical protein